MDYRREDYSIALQRAVEYHCKGELVPDYIASECPHHAAMLNRHLSDKSTRPDNAEAKSKVDKKVCLDILDRALRS